MQDRLHRYDPDARALKRTLRAATIFTATGLVLHAPALAASLKQIRFGESPEGTRIVFDLDAPLKSHPEISSADGVLRVTLADVSKAGAKVRPFNGAVTEVRDNAGVGALEYTFVLPRGAAIKNAFAMAPQERGGAHRFVIDLAPTTAVAAAAKNKLPPVVATSDANSGRSEPAILGASRKEAAKPETFASFQSRPRPSVTWKTSNLVEVQYEPLGLSVTQSQRLGPDVVAAQKYLQTGGLDATKSWRSEIDAEYVLVDDGETTADLNFGLFSTFRPLSFTRGGIATNSFDRWRGNAVADAAFAMTALNGRLSLASGIALSETTLRYGRENEPWLWIYEEKGLRSRANRDSAMFQKLAAKIVDSQDFEASFDLLYVNTGNDFRSFQSNTVADILYEDETLNLSSQIVAGGSKIEYHKEAHADPIYAFDRNTFRLTQGAIELKATIATESAHASGIVFFDDAIVSGKLALDLNKVFGALRLLPDEVSVGYSEKSALKEALFNTEHALRSSIGIGARKSGAHFSTDFYVFWNAHNDFNEADHFTAAREFGIDVTQSFFGDGWDLSLYVGMSDLNRRRVATIYGSESTLTGGIAFSREFEKLPDVKISFDAFNFAADYIVADDAFRRHDLTLQTDIDVSELLITRQSHAIDRARPLSVYFAAYQGWSVSEDAFVGEQREPETRLLLLLRRSR